MNMNDEFTRSEGEFLKELCYEDENQSLLDYSHLNDLDTVLSRSLAYFKRKYFDGISVPIDQMKECLKAFFTSMLSKDEFTINERFVVKAHDFAFSLDMGRSASHELQKFIKNAKVEAVRGIALVVVVLALLQRRGFINITSSMVVNHTPNSSSNSPAFDSSRIHAEFTEWRVNFNPEDAFGDDIDECSRLLRFYHISKILFQLSGKGKGLKGLYIFVGACLEGIPDGITRLYAIGGQMKDATLRRISIFEKITDVPKRNRRPKGATDDSTSEEANQGVTKTKRRKNRSCSSSDEVETKASSTSGYGELEERASIDNNDEDANNGNKRRKINRETLTLDIQEYAKSNFGLDVDDPSSL